MADPVFDRAQLQALSHGDLLGRKIRKEAKDQNASIGFAKRKHEIGEPLRDVLLSRAASSRACGGSRA